MLNKIIDSSFNNLDHKKVIEQTAIIEFKIKKGYIDTFHIWSIYKKEESEYLKNIFTPLIGRYFHGYLKFEYLLLPLRIVGPITGGNEILSDDYNFINTLVEDFKHITKSKITISQGILLDTDIKSIR